MQNVKVLLIIIYYLNVISMCIVFIFNYLQLHKSGGTHPVLSVSIIQIKGQD